jgi:3-methyl-2-oxobutanoate hydroxymethyltransferase
MLTAYTCPVARCLEKAGIPAILVGDTVGMVEIAHVT